MTIAGTIREKSGICWLFAFLLPVLAACGEVETPQAPPSSALSEPDEAEFAKSPNDRREYRTLVLENELRVVLISDPETDKAAAALDVFAGSNSDPAQYPGLAHFLEHMLFLGTARYPEAGEYQEYISSHGGGHNAYTAYENTNYYFDIEKDYLAPALDRFSQFFIAPLFTPDYVERERNAVHSEYQSNLQNDGRRSYSILKKVINQDHPLSGFSVGSLETLADDGSGSLREALLAQYERYYSANLMSLAILGSESLDQLEDMAREYFAAIPNRSAERPATDEPLFTQGTLPALLQIDPVRDVRSLSYSFPIPVVHPYYKSKPLNYLGNVIGHEGEGSLLSLLRERGWANGLSAGGGMSYRDNATFSISLSLTEEGVNRIDEISSLVFQFIELTREQGIQPWLFEEQKNMAEISFLFQEPSQPIGYVSSLAQRLQEYPAAEILTAPYTFEEFDPELLQMLLSWLRPDNVLLTFTNNSAETDTTDPLFGGSYSIAPLSEARLAGWTGAAGEPALAITEPNPFLPEDLSLKPLAGEISTDGVQDKPDLIVDGNGIRLWFKQDDEFRVPRANFYFYAMTPLFSNSLENSLLSSFVISLVNDKLNEYSYPANLAGVFYGVSGRARGFSVRLGGYEDKQATLLREVLETIVAADFEQARFDIIRSEMVRGWENAEKQTPYIRLFQEVQALLVNPYWSEQEKIAAVQDISLEQVREFVPRMLSNVSIDALYHGNVLEEDALALLDIVSDYLTPSDQVERPPFGTVVQLQPEQKVVQEVGVEHEDSAIVIYQQGPDDSDRTRGLISLLSSIIRTPFYDALRTEQQLGYVVSAGTLPILDTSGLVFYIESPGYDPLTLEARIEEFLAGYEARLDEMPQTMFEDIKAGLLNNMRQKPQRLSNLSGRYWSDILIEEYESDSTLAMADLIEGLGKAEVLDYFRLYISNPDSRRIVAVSSGTGHQQAYLEQRDQALQDATVISELIDSETAFKNQAEVYRFNP